MELTSLTIQPSISKTPPSREALARRALRAIGVFISLLNSVTKSFSPREVVGTCSRNYEAIDTRGRHSPTQLVTLFAPRARAPRVDGALL